jgi:hypothetical protein
MRLAGIVLTGAAIGGSLMVSSGGLSRAQPVQTEAGLFAPAGECIAISRNLVGIVTVAGVKNKCDQPFTLVLHTSNGSEIVNVPPHFETKWNTTLFSRWKVCPGVSSPSC